MMSIWLLAARNLLRNRRRSLATLLALTLASAAIQVFGGFSANIRDSLMTAYVRTGGHLQIQHSDFYLYGNGNPTEYGIAGYERLLAAIRNDPTLKPNLKVATPTLQLAGIAGNFDAGLSRTVIGFGLIPEDINLMRRWNDLDVPMVAARFALEGAPLDAAIVGIGVARVLQICDALAVSHCPRPTARVRPAGKKSLPADVAALAAAEARPQHSKAKGDVPHIELLAGQGRGTPNVATLRVIAAEDQGFKEADEVTTIMHLRQAQSLVYGRSEPRATALIVQLTHTHLLEEAAERLKTLLTQIAPEQALTVLDFQTLNPFFKQTMDMFDMIFGFIFALIGGIVLFTVGNTMNAAVVERTTEIGTLRSIGLRRSGIVQLFIAEGLILGGSGALAGLAVALFSSEIVNYLHLTWLPPGSSERLPLFLKVRGEGWMLLSTVTGLIAIASLSAWWPARRAAKLKIVDALRHT